MLNGGICAQCLLLAIAVDRVVALAAPAAYRAARKGPFYAAAVLSAAAFTALQSAPLGRSPVTKAEQRRLRWASLAAGFEWWAQTPGFCDIAAVRRTNALRLFRPVFKAVFGEAFRQSPARFQLNLSSISTHCSRSDCGPVSGHARIGPP